jgi:hypothetical protein
MFACSNSQKETPISSEVINEVINTLSKQAISPDLLEKGVKQTARLWQKDDGSEDEFKEFCLKNYITDPKEKEQVFLKISNYLESIQGYFNEMSLDLQINIHENTGPLSSIDESFAAYSPATHLSDDLYANKLAFVITLNFPELSLEEKESLGNNRLEWAYARMGDIFTNRIPAKLQQAYSQANSEADVYIAGYNVYAGKLLNEEGEKQFPEDMILLSHWNIRDEIKTNYGLEENGLNKQKTLYEVMKRIISQEIPREVINSGKYEWNPYGNTVFQNGSPIDFSPENGVRYEKFLNNFKALKAIDLYTGDTYIKRNFSDDMGIAVEDVEKLFREYLSSPELKELGKVIESRLKRKLQPFDIWYDGFKSRSTLNEDDLSRKTRQLYPDALAFEKALPGILQKLGFNKERAEYIAEKIEVDAARGSGHAWGAAHKKQKAHLRTRIPTDGMDYKGYNIAIHEFGHNVEQTISLYDVDYYMLNGVPNTAFTEALAFVFQKRDLELLGITDNNPEAVKNDIMDKAWQLYEITGVSLLDIEIWKWLYAHPNATSKELQNETIRLAKEIWNQYYSPVFGTTDETILAIYSHMVSYPLYLSAYAFGQIIEFQLEQYLNDKNFASEVDRIYRLGQLTPNQWMLQATGTPLSIEPLLNALRNDTELSGGE